ncbi:MAG: hypothetical protein JW719_04365 [Pirellulales bacterium]|nr:hypothetical protein [Pirellulales bacterium]
MKSTWSVVTTWGIFFLLGGVLVAAPGCANQRLIDLQRGTSCSAENVQTYAKARNLTYEQALAEMRKEDQQLWDQEEKTAADRRQPPGGDQAAAMNEGQ